MPLKVSVPGLKVDRLGRLKTGICEFAKFYYQRVPIDGGNYFVNAFVYPEPLPPNYFSGVADTTYAGATFNRADRTLGTEQSTTDTSTGVQVTFSASATTPIPFAPCHLKGIARLVVTCIAAERTGNGYAILEDINATLKYSTGGSFQDVPNGTMHRCLTDADVTRRRVSNGTLLLVVDAVAEGIDLDLTDATTVIFALNFTVSGRILSSGGSTATGCVGIAHTRGTDDTCLYLPFVR